MTLNDVEGHSPVSELFNASRLHLCSTLQDFNWHARVARSLSDSWASCCCNETIMAVLLSQYYTRVFCSGREFIRFDAVNIWNITFGRISLALQCYKCRECFLSIFSHEAQCVLFCCCCLFVGDYRFFLFRVITSIWACYYSQYCV